MYKSSKTGIAAMLMLSIFIYTSNVVAKDCYEPSPNLIDRDKEYFNLKDTKALSNQEKNKLYDFFRNITGRWKGESTQIECRGPDRAPRKKYKQAIITAKATLASNGNLTISTKKHYIKERVHKNDNLTLLENLRIHEFGFLNDNHLIFSEKYNLANNFVTDPKTETAKTRKTIKQAIKYKNPNEVKTKTQTTKHKTSRTLETIYELTLNANTLILLKSFYTNGVYTGEEQWTMYSN